MRATVVFPGLGLMMAGWLFSHGAPMALGAELVVPAGFASVNGQVGGVPTLAYVLRVQQIYGASMFPPGPISIHGIRWRPVATASAFETTIADIQFNLSTTTVQPNALNAAFASNVGPNDTVVFNGSLHISSALSGPAGGPKDFDIILPFTKSFRYDPAAGNLLVDMRNRSGSTAEFLDISGSTTDNASRASALRADALTASTLDTGADIIQLVYSPADTPPSIRTQPQNSSVLAGQTALFSVEVLGTLPLRYQWKFNGQNLPGQTNSTLTLPGVVPSRAGTYTVQVTNDGGTILSLPATLTVTETANPLVLPPTHTTQNGNWGTQPFTSALRIQQIYAGSFFPPEPIVIRQLRWRPHGTLGAAFDATLANLRINLSTSTADSNQLSSVFAANVGPDEVTVYQGSVQLASAFTGPAQGPKDFDIVILLQEPFLYDPSAGALLVDMRNLTASPVTTLDGTGEAADGASRAIAFNADAATASVVDRTADIIQVIYNPLSIPPSIVLQPQSATVQAETSATLSVTAAGDPPLSYQWRFNGTDIEGATSHHLVLDDLSVEDSGAYSVRVTNPLGSVLSQEALLAVQVDPRGPWHAVLDNGFEETTAFAFITAGLTFSGWRVDSGSVDVLTHNSGFIGLSHSGVNAIDLNGNESGIISSNVTTIVGRMYLLEFAFSKNPQTTSPSAEMVLNGTKVLTFQFTQPNSDSSLNWQTTSVVFTATSPTTKVTFKSLASGGGGVYLDTIRMRRWQPAPHLVMQPLSQHTFAGNTVTLQVEAGGSPPLAYQWLFNGVAIEGASSDRLVLNSVQAGQAGLYSVRISNGLGTKLSQEAALTVATDSGGPWHYLLDDGFEQTAGYTTIAAGQRVSGWLVDAGIIKVLTYKSGLLGASHTGLNAVELNGSQSDTISTNFPTAAGESYLLTFAFTKIPQSGPTSAEVLVDSDSVMSFQYTTPNSDSSLNWQTTSMVFTATSSITKLAFKSLLTGVADGIYLDSIRVKVAQPDPHLNLQPASQIAFAGRNVTLRVAAGGNPPLAYQWLFNGAPMDGATTDTLVLNGVQAEQAGLYSIRVSNGLGTVLSQEAQLTILEDPQHPGGILLSNGFEETVAYRFVSSGQFFSGWRVDTGDIDVLGDQQGIVGPSHSGINAIDLSGVRAGTISTNLSTSAGQTYTLEFAFSKNPVNAAASAEVSLNNVPLLLFTHNQPTTASALNWQTTSVVFTASSDMTKLAFRSLMDGSAGVYLDTIQVSRWPQAPMILVAPRSQAGALGGTVVFGIQAGGDLPISYQWLFNGAELPGQTLPTLSLANLQYAHQGEYAIRVVNWIGSVTSVPAVLTVLQTPAILTQPQDLNVGENEEALFQVTATGGEPLAYQWFRNGTAIPGATGTSLVLTHVPLNAAGSYTVKVSNPVGSVTSTPAILTINPDLGRAMLLPNVTNTLGATLAVPVLFLPDGNENGLGFSISFDASVLELLRVELGANAAAAGAFLNVNDTQAASGRLGLNLVLPFGQTFPEGTQAVVSITFSISKAGGVGVSPLHFGDSPIVREVSDIDAESLPTLFVDGSVRVSGGLEADVSPGQDGNNQVTITDWVKVGRYAAGLDVVPNATHFQRADCAPRTTLGNGLLTVSDWVQAGRYATLLDPWAAAGGPTSSGAGGGVGLAAVSQDAGDRAVQILSVQAEPGQTLSLPIQLTSTGHENALGFSLSFDPAKLRFLGAGPGADTSGASFNVNSNQQAAGSLGLALSLPVGAKFAAGTRRIALVQFATTPNAAGDVAVGFSDDPVLREVSDPLANVLAASYDSGTIHVIPILHFRRTEQGLVLSWPAAATGYILESAEMLDAQAPWTAVDAEYVSSGSEVQVTVPAAGLQHFYRLHKSQP